MIAKSLKPIFNKDLHERVLVGLLLSIFREKDLSKVLAFKGGTALYFFYDLPRFSTDLDFEIIKPLSDEQVKEVYEKVKRICVESGSVIKDSAIKKNTVLVKCSYSPRHRRVKIEISLRLFLSKWEVKRFLGMPVRVLKPEDVVAQKLIAVSTRTKETAIARDIFDLWFVLVQKKWQPDKELIEKIAGKKADEIVEKAIKTVESFSSSRILQNVGELVDVKAKEFIRQNTVRKQLLIQLRVLLYTFGKRSSIK